MHQRDKWALAFDARGLWYGVMTINCLELFNKVFKGIHAVPVLGIVEYSFRKCNEYFVNQRNIAKVSKEKTLGSLRDDSFQPSGGGLWAIEVSVQYQVSRRNEPGGVRSTVVGIIGWTLRKRNALVTFHNSFMTLTPMSLQLADAGV